MQIRDLFSPFLKCPVEEEQRINIPLREDAIILTGHRSLPSKNLFVSADLNTFYAYNLLKFHDIQFEFESEGIPDMATFPDALPYLITTKSHQYFSTIQLFISALNIQNPYDDCFEYSALKFAIEKYCYLPFYKWLWNEDKVYREFTLDFYSYKYPIITRLLHMKRIYGKFYYNFVLNQVRILVTNKIIG